MSRYNIAVDSINKYDGELGIVNNLGSHTLAIIYKIILQFYSYKQVAEVVGDYNSALALVRYMADAIRSFVFVYDTNNQEEQKIRHCLYVLDGVNQSLEELLYPIIKMVEATPKNLESLNSFVYHLTHYSLLKTSVNLFVKETFRREVLENNPDLTYLLTDEELKHLYMNKSSK